MRVQQIALLICILHKTLSDDIATVCSKKNAPNTKCKLMCYYYKNGKIDKFGGFIESNFSTIYRPSLSYCEDKMESEDDCEKVIEMNKCIIEDVLSTFQSCASHTNSSIKQLIPLEVLPISLSEDKACYQRCIYRQYKIINYKDEVNAKELQIYLETHLKVEKMVEMCREENVVDDPCVGILRTLQCVKKSLNEKYVGTRKDCITSLKMKTDDNGLPTISDPQQECMLYCTYQKADLVDNNGRINALNFNRYYLPAFEICEKQLLTEKNICKRANKILNCIFLEADLIRKKCRAQTKMANFISGTFPVKIDPKQACYFVCLYKYYHFVTENDELDRSWLVVYSQRQSRDKQIIDALITTCINNNKKFTDKCLRLVHTLHCINSSAFQPRFTS